MRRVREPAARVDRTRHTFSARGCEDCSSARGGNNGPIVVEYEVRVKGRDKSSPHNADNNNNGLDSHAPPA